jgi:hypothetical protein
MGGYAAGFLGDKRITEVRLSPTSTSIAISRYTNKLKDVDLITGLRPAFSPSVGNRLECTYHGRKVLIDILLYTGKGPIPNGWRT